MKIVHLYGGNLYGGVERLLAALARHREEARALEQRFALCFRARLWQELESLGVEVHDLGRVRARYPWQVVSARRRLAAWLRDEPADLAVCHAWWSYALFGPACRRAGVRVALWVHDCASGQGWLERWAGLHRPDATLTWGPYMAAGLQRLFPDARTRLWIPPIATAPALPPAQRRALRRSLDTEEGAVVLLQASRLERWKGHALLLEALGRLGTQTNWVAWFAGGAQRPQERRYAAELRQQAQRLGLEPRIRWLGERQDVAELMGAADIFCQTNSSPEPFGVVFLEAQAAGLPVVATRGGGASELITPESGLLPAPEAGAIAAALEELIGDPQRRTRMQAAARLRAQTRTDAAGRMLELASLLAGACA